MSTATETRLPGAQGGALIIGTLGCNRARPSPGDNGYNGVAALNQVRPTHPR